MSCASRCLSSVIFDSCSAPCATSALSRRLRKSSSDSFTSLAVLRRSASSAFALPSSWVPNLKPPQKAATSATRDTAAPMYWNMPSPVPLPAAGPRSDVDVLDEVLHERPHAAGDRGARILELGGL